jgi:hypothetical protein
VAAAAENGAAAGGDAEATDFLKKKAAASGAARGWVMRGLSAAAVAAVAALWPPRTLWWELAAPLSGLSLHDLLVDLTSVGRQYSGAVHWCSTVVVQVLLQAPQVLLPS